MEVEVKFRLRDSTSHESLSTLLSPSPIHFQHNHFFDTDAYDLRAHRAALRIRFYGEHRDFPTTCVVSLKAKAVIIDGISTVAEDEENIDPTVGRANLSDPDLIRKTPCRILDRVRGEFGIKDGSGYICLGGYENVRGFCKWNGLTLELDQTSFKFGTLYEVECESEEPERAKEMIEGLLRDSGIQYSYSIMSKFAIYQTGKLPALGESKIRSRSCCCSKLFSK